MHPLGLFWLNMIMHNITCMQCRMRKAAENAVKQDRDRWLQTYSNGFIWQEKAETRMTAIVLRQDPNTWKVLKNAISSKHWTKLKEISSPSHFLSSFTVWKSFCDLMKEISPKIRMLCFVLINSVRLHHLCVWILFGSRHFSLLHIQWCWLTLKITINGNAKTFKKGKEKLSRNFKSKASKYIVFQARLVVLLVHSILYTTRKSNNSNARLMAFAPSLALDHTFGIRSHKTLDT